MFTSIETMLSLICVIGFLNHELLKPLREGRYDKNKDY